MELKICYNCQKRPIAKFGKAHDYDLCTPCAWGTDESRRGTSSIGVGYGILSELRDQSLKKKRRDLRLLHQVYQTGGVRREEKFKANLAIGFSVTGKKFERWANQYIEENL